MYIYVHTYLGASFSIPNFNRLIPLINKFYFYLKSYLIGPIVILCYHLCVFLEIQSLNE